MGAGNGSLPYKPVQLSFVSGCAIVAKLQHKKKAVKQNLLSYF